MSELINPIVIDKNKNTCSSCGGEIVLIQHESSLINIDKDGLPVDTATLLFEIKGICKDCYKEIDIEKNGMYFRKYSSYLNAKKKIEMEKETSNPFYRS